MRAEVKQLLKKWHFQRESQMKASPEKKMSQHWYTKAGKFLLLIFSIFLLDQNNPITKDQKIHF
jgi:hypothetical protein